MFAGPFLQSAHSTLYHATQNPENPLLCNSKSGKPGQFPRNKKSKWERKKIL